MSADMLINGQCRHGIPRCNRCPICDAPSSLYPRGGSTLTLPPELEELMRKPTDGRILVNRTRSNNDWLAQCENLHRDEQKRIGQVAREARERRGLSLRTLATKMKVSAPFLSDLERGNRNWTTHMMEAWATIIDASNDQDHP